MSQRRPDYDALRATEARAIRVAVGYSDMRVASEAEAALGRRKKQGPHQQAKAKRARDRRWKSSLWYGQKYGFPQVISNGGKP